MRRLVLFLVPTLAPLACVTSGNITPTDDAGDSGTVVVPPTSACSGDPSACISGTFATKLFTAVPSASKVELFRTYPGGSTTAIASQPVAMDGTFAFSGLSPWAHYYVRAIGRFGSATSGTSVSTMRGRLAVPNTAGSVALTLIPAQLEMLETTYKGGARNLQWISAHLFDPGTGSEITQATVSVSGTGLTATAMPFGTNFSSQQSFFVSFPTPATNVSALAIQVTHPSFGASGHTFTIGQEAGSFDEPAILTPASATVPVGQPISVTWAADPPQADYAVVAFFEKKNGSFVGKYGTQSPLAADVTSETIPASAVPEASAYLLNLNVSQTTCGGASSDGCSNLFHVAQAGLTAQ